MEFLSLPLKITSPTDGSGIYQTATIPDSDAIDHVKAMIRQENDPAYKCHDYFSYLCIISNDHVGSSAKAVDLTCRVKMVEWMYQVADFCHFSRESVCVATSYFDRFLSSMSPLAIRVLSDQKKYQLSAMTALYISVKTREPLVISPSLLSEVSQGVYTTDDIEQMERDMLHVLGWRLSCPTSFEFAQHFATFLSPIMNQKVISVLLDYVKYQIELSVGNYDFSRILPSVVAIASIRNALECTSTMGLSYSDLAGFLRQISDMTGIDVLSADVQSVMEKLMAMLRNSVNANTMGMSSVKVLETTADSPRSMKRSLSPVCVARQNPPFQRKRHNSFAKGA